MKFRIWIFLVLTSLPAFAQKAMTLAKDGKSDYVIALAADAIPAEQTAARELQDHIKQISGATLEIKSETQVPANVPQILVGAGPRVRATLPNQDWKSLGSDGIVVKTSGKMLILAGGRPRGTLYAVYEYLEILGCRFWAPGESTIPKLNTPATVWPLNIVYTPPFSYREHYTTSVQRDALFGTRLRENGHHQPQKNDLGGHYSIIGFVHTMDSLLPPDRYFAAHPDWFADPQNSGLPCTEKSKLPAPQTWQPCFTNSEARQELIQNVLAKVRAEPQAGIISVSQNDNTNRCQCERCKALEAAEGSPVAPLLQTVNAVAAQVAKEFPGFLVETLAYQHTRKPPKTLRPAENVVIRLCSIEADFSQPLESESNATFRDDIAGWKAIAPRLYIWDYVTNFTNSVWPHPNFRVLGPNLRLFARSNVIGVFEQGDAYSNGTGDFPQLRAWLVGKLMWNPQQDENKLTDEFLRGYYGAAAPFLRGYLELMQDAFARTQQKLSTFQNNHAWLTLAVMNEATRHFRAASEAVKADAMLSARVRRARLPLDHVWIVRYAALKRRAITEKSVFGGPDDLAAFGDEFLKANDQFRTENHHEGGPWADYSKSLRQSFVAAKPAPLPAALKIAAGSDVLDAQEFSFNLYRRGELSDIVADAAASNGFAGRIVGHTNEWAVQWNPDDDADFLRAAPWHCYAVIRVEIKPGAPKEGVAFTTGIYNSNDKITAASAQRTLAETADGTFQIVDIGTVPLQSGVFFWAAPANNANVAAIYVDRFLCVRAK